MTIRKLAAAANSAIIVIGLIMSSCSAGTNNNQSATASSAKSHAKMSRADMSCPRTPVALQFKDAVLASGGTIEPIHTRDGLAVLATAPSADGTARIRAAAQAYLQQSQQVTTAQAAPTAKLSASCSQVLAALQAGTVVESTADTEKGTLLSISTSDPRLVQLLQQGDCCKFCTCPSTNWRCAGCC
jgi:hypothetical protein